MKENTEAYFLAGVGGVKGAAEYYLKPLFRKDPESRAGTLGWAGLGLGVLAWDIIAPETLSHAYKRGLEHPKLKFMCIGLLGATALHLMEKK